MFQIVLSNFELHWKQFISIKDVCNLKRQKYNEKWKKQQKLKKINFLIY